MTRKIKFLIVALFVAGLLFLFSYNQANADEIQIVQVSPSDQNFTDTSTVTVEIAQVKIDNAESTLNQEAQTQSESIISTIQANVPNTDTATAISIATSQEPIATAVSNASAKIEDAHNAIQSAQTAVSLVISAQINIDTQTVVVQNVQNQVDSATATVATNAELVANVTTDLSSAQTSLNQANQNVTDQQVIVVADQYNVNSAQAVVDSSTTPGLKETIYQDTGYNNAPPLGAGVVKVVTTDTNGINENFGGGSPASGVLSDDFQINWTGIWTPTYTGTQWIYAPADDGTKLYLDGVLVINDWYDKGGGGSTAAVSTTAGVGKVFNFWYYENGGGANVALMRYNGNGTWSPIPASEFSQSSATTQQIADLNSAKVILITDTNTLNDLIIVQSDAQNTVDQVSQNLTNAQQNLTNSQSNLLEISQNLTNEQQNLINSQQNLTIVLQTANSLADTATTKVNDAVFAMQNASQIAIDYYAEQQRIAAEQAAVLAAQQAAEARAAALAAQQAAEAAAAAQAKAEADAKAAAEQAAKALADQQAAEAAKAKAEADALAAQKAAEEKSIQDAAEAKAKADQEVANAKAEADAKAAAEQAAKAEADKKAAEQAAADKSAADAKVAADKAAQDAANKAAEQAAKDQVAKDAQAKSDALKAEQEAKDKAIADAIGVKPNNPNQLSDTIIKEAPKEVLVPHIQVDKVGVENGGIEFFGTKSAPQVVGEDGKLTPAAPPPGSGLPIPAEAITTQDTFIGQPGGTTFNAPDIAVPVIETPLPATLAAVPGAAAINHAFVAMANIGNDMSPVTRKKAKKILVLTVAVAAIRRRFN